MIFKDRKHAGQELAKKLIEYNNKPDTVVVALPRGGVVLGYEVAKELNLPLDIVVPRKIGAPENEEFAIGAISEEGDFVKNIEAGEFDKKYIDDEIVKEKEEAKRRLETYRPGMRKRDFNSKAILLVDDGIATGLTMLAAIKTLKNMKARKIIVAVPVSADDSFEKTKKEVDEIITLDKPVFFGAVGQFYETFDQTEDDEVVDLMQKANKLYEI